MSGAGALRGSSAPNPKRAGLSSLPAPRAGCTSPSTTATIGARIQGNLPNTSYRDAVIKGNDLIVGTYGRGLYILDDISTLRQMNARHRDRGVHLYAPADAMRLRRNVGQDTRIRRRCRTRERPGRRTHSITPSPPTPPREVTLDVLDPAGTVIRHLSQHP